MKTKSLYKIILSLLLTFWVSSAWAANTIKWSMQGDSLTPVSYTHLTLPTNREV